MALEFIPTRADQSQFPVVQAAITTLQQKSEELEIDGGILYDGWPKFQDYEAIGHPVDIALLSKRTGLLLIRHLANTTSDMVAEADESISQAAANAEAQMLKSALLRGPRRKLKFEVVPILYAPGYDDSDLQSELVKSEKGLISFIQNIKNQNLGDTDIDEARSILEGAKALARSVRRRVDDPFKKPAAAALSHLEEEIARFDAQQRYVALTNLACPQRIRGLAGSGKTIILVMKAALAHIEKPSAKILVTYYTRSLRDHLTKSITRFYRHFAEGEPDWKNIDVQHGWGQKNLPGVYREASVRAGLIPISFGEAQAQKTHLTTSAKPSWHLERYIHTTTLFLLMRGRIFLKVFTSFAFFLQRVIEIIRKLYGRTMNCKISSMFA